MDSTRDLHLLSETMLLLGSRFLVVTRMKVSYSSTRTANASKAN